MATIVTVHGTFAAGAVHGAEWWQLDSEFERDMRKYVEADQAELAFVPVPWDGRNSEGSRRDAGRVLLARMLELEAAGEHYSVIGHSHGGSVICLALLEAVNRHETLPGLVSWITVGTPFVALRKQRMLFSRVSNFGKSTLVTLSTFLLLFLLSFYFDKMGASLKLGVLAMLIAPFAAVYGAMLYVNTLAFHIHRKANWVQFEERFGSKWVPLNHRDDEAIEGLGAFGRVKLEIFDRHFAVGPLTFLGAVLVPILLIVLLFSPWLMTRFEALVGKDNRFGSNDEVRANVEFVADTFKGAAQSFANAVQAKVDTAFSLIPIESLRFGVEAVFSFITLIMIPIFAILVVGYGILVAIGYLSGGASQALSWVLNRMAQGQIRATAYGYDMTGETAFNASRTPFGMRRAPPPALPDDLALEISRFSDDEAVKSIPQLRGVLKTLALSEGGVGQPDIISKYLTGYELIHTSYFRLPRFRKLVAYILAGSPGFKEAQVLSTDPDYELLQAWDLHVCEQGFELKN